MLEMKENVHILRQTLLTTYILVLILKDQVQYPCPFGSHKINIEACVRKAERRMIRKGFIS